MAHIMNLSKKHLILTLLVLLISIPSWAVFDEKDLGQTLSELRLELSQEINSRSSNMTLIDEKSGQQRKEMLKLVKKCNELSLMLYSQKQDCTFDLTYAVKQVTSEYEDYNKSRLPYEDLMARLNLEIDRYARLVEALRRLPPQLVEIDELPDHLAYHNDSISDADQRTRQEMMKERMDNMGRIIDSLGLNRQFNAFLLNSKEMEDRDSCIHYAITILKLYSDAKDKIAEDKAHYEQARVHIQEAYDYARDRYRTLQKRTFTQKQENYLTGVLANFKSFKDRAFNEAARKYSQNAKFNTLASASSWRGPLFIKFLTSLLMGFLESLLFSFAVFYTLAFLLKKYKDIDIREARARMSLLGGMVIFALLLLIFIIAKKGSFVSMASKQLLTYCWMVIAILASILFRLKGKKASSTLALYLPLILLGLLVILFRILFISDMMMNLCFPPLLAATFVWMFIVCITTVKNTEKNDMLIGWLSTAVLFATTITSIFGYVFLSVLFIIWWLFFVSVIETIFATLDLVRLYEQNRLNRKVSEYSLKKRNIGITGSKKKGECFNITWFDDLMNMCIIPVLAAISIPFSVKLALNVFDMHAAYDMFMNSNFFEIHGEDGQPMLQQSVLKFAVTASLFFIFRYIAYATKAIFREIKINKYLQKNRVSVMNVNDVNLTLSNNIIDIVVWFIFAVTIILLFKIPVGAISMVATGLAAGIGLALKDVINNFIYGIQLMSGRLHVGDWIDVNGVRGEVKEISYQSTQIETIEGASISFLNADLFSRNFRNLTKSDKYEMVKIFVGIGYGSNVEEVRRILLDTLSKQQDKDPYGCDIVDKSRNIVVDFENFGASSVDISISQFILVSQSEDYVPVVKEMIYNTLTEHNIELPFPQTDVHIKQ